ncbi:hypothetical protein BOTBODRAFT_29092 [Botryobasidium botryosum FD-172 SS1]|uniref:Molybdate-anion transporter n=1 Tax=Botryobasidium botryosum (strain FD-172 SS1) TaxID=930990 RepID=A0A067N4L9_BOTB1|nr:hypothetical protein BOTBODRAFT_29092 [Botryobasidium botryosum FD-172 SS1]
MVNLNPFFLSQLVYLSVFCVCGILAERYIANRRQQRAGRDRRGDEVSNAGEARKLAWNYLLVYAVVMGADWLQGPYVYSLYKEQYDFPPQIVAVLFVTGFMSAGFAAPLVGVWADQYGRKRLCLYFCLSYIGACVCILFPILPVLVAGRVLGGVSTSILFSCFESWLVASSQSSGVAQSDLSSIMGRASLINGFVASAMGVVSNELVSFTGTYTSPFIASAGLLGLSYAMISGLWTENYGGGAGSKRVDIFQISRIKQAWHIVREDPSLLTLGLTQTCFEGSMYLFVFLWVPSMENVSGGASLPLGYIFSSFMFSMMIGSLIYTIITSSARTKAPSDSPLVLHAKLSSLVCLTAGLALAASMSTDTAQTRFWAFCVFEACVGMYYPTQGMLRGSMISNDHRATLSSLFRVPLNIFVVAALLTGVSSARNVFAGCTLSLMFSSIMTAFVIVRRASEPSPIPINLREVN